MRKAFTVFILAVLLLAGVSAQAEEGPVEKFTAKTIDRLDQSCHAEFETYCRDVTPGQGRDVACLYAHSNKISTPCLTALYETKNEFFTAVENLNTYIEACQADAIAFCSKVAIGEGRILKCLEENTAKITAKCRANLKSMHGDIGKPKAAVS